MNQKILFLITQDLSSPSGGGRYFPWAKELAKIGFNVSLIGLHPDYKNINNSQIIIEGVRVEFVGPMHVKKIGNAKYYYPFLQLLILSIYSTFRLLIKALEVNAHFIIIGKPHPMNSVAGLIVKMLRPKTKIFLDCDDIEVASNRFPNHASKLLMKFFEDQVPKIVDLVTANTIENINRLLKLGIMRERLIYIPNGIDSQRVHIENLKVENDKKIDLDCSTKKYILYSGSLSLNTHPIDLLLQAFILLKEKVNDCKLVIVGGGEDFGLLKKMVGELNIDDYVLFIGRVHQKELQDIYSISAVSVDPVYDNAVARGRCPLKMFESWLFGVPFVTCDVGDRKLLAGNPPAVVFFDAGNPHDLSEKLEKTLSDNAFRQNMIQLGKIRVQNYFWEKIISQTSWIFFN